MSRQSEQSECAREPSPDSRQVDMRQRLGDAAGPPRASGWLATTILIIALPALCCRAKHPEARPCAPEDRTEGGAWPRRDTRRHRLLQTRSDLRVPYRAADAGCKVSLDAL